MTNLRSIGPVMLIGAGKMGMALATGWLEAGLPPTNLVLVEPRPSEEIKAFAAEYDLKIYDHAVGLLPNVLVLEVNETDPVSLVRFKNVLLTKGAVAKMEEMLG